MFLSQSHSGSIRGCAIREMVRGKQPLIWELSDSAGRLEATLSKKT